MSSHQEIISKPAALYKNIGPQDKPKPVSQKSGSDGQKNETEDAKFQLPPELADLFQDGGNASADNNPEESKGQNHNDDHPNYPQGYDGSNVQGSNDERDDYDDEEDDYKVDGMHGASKKIGKMNRMNNKKPQQNIKNRMPKRGNPHSPYEESGEVTPQMLNKPVLGAQCYFKTKLCPHLQQNGACNKGERCTYAHNPNELRDQPDLRRTKVCHIFKSGGKCPNGNSCNFAHGEGELRSTPEFYKTAPCQNWAKGSCVHGNKCRFAHGDKELRVVPNKPLTQNSGSQQKNQPDNQQQNNFQNFQQPGMLVPNYTYVAQTIPMNYMQMPTQVVYQQPDMYQNQMYMPTGYTATTQFANPQQMNFQGQINQMQYQPMYGYGYPNGGFTSGNAPSGGNQ